MADGSGSNRGDGGGAGVLDDGADVQVVEDGVIRGPPSGDILN